MPNYKAFQKALNQIAADTANTDKAYQKVPTINEVTKPMQQYMFLRDYNRLCQSPFEPITATPGSRLRKQELLGLNYTHDGITEEIDFRKPENAEYKRIFEESYLKMTLHPRTQSKYGDFHIVKEQFEYGPGYHGTNKDSIGIMKYDWYERGSLNDPLTALNTDDADFVRYIISDLRQKTRREKKIVLETNDILLTRENEETGGIDIYTTTAGIKDDDETKWKKAKKVLSVTDENIKNIPFDALYSMPEIKYGRHPDYIREIDLRPAKNGGQIELLIQDDGMPPTKTELQEAARKQETRKMETYNLLARYGRYGIDKASADVITKDYEFKTFGNDTHSEMITEMSNMLLEIKQAGSYAIRQSMKEQNLGRHNIEAATAGYMSRSCDRLEYFPIYDKSDGQTTWHVPIAIAARHKYDKAQPLYGILRLDDPQAKIIYDLMKACVQDALRIPENQKTEPAHKPAQESEPTPARTLETETAKDRTPAPSPEEIRTLLSKFKASMTDMQRQDAYAITKAYQKAASIYPPSEANRQQRKFLTELGKITDIPFAPIEARGKSNKIYMSGIRFTRNGETHDIDFTKDEYKPIRQAFDNAFLEMTLDARVNGDYRQITQDIDYKGDITIKSSKIKGQSADPLGRDTAKLTARLIQKTPNYSEQPNITIETKKTLLVRRDLNSDGYVIYASEASPNSSEKEQWEKAYPIMRTDKGMAPASMNIAAIKYTGGKNPHQHITEIRFGHNGLHIERENPEPEAAPTKPAKNPIQSRNEAFAFMTEYAQIADTDAKSRLMLERKGIDPDACHDDMLKDLHVIEAGINKMSDAQIGMVTAKTRTINPRKEDIGPIASSLIRKKINGTAYYPMYDRTRNIKETNRFIGIAAVNADTYDIKGVLRTDEPEVDGIFKNITGRISESLDLVPSGKQQQTTGSRHIPDSQKPEFMREDNRTTQDGMQYE